jgi:hypothetical protein
MKLNLLFSVKNVVLLLLALFYLLIFTHNLLGNIFEGYETSDPITSKDDAVTVQNKLDYQNAGAQTTAPGSTDASQLLPAASTGDLPQSVSTSTSSGDPSQPLLTSDPSQSLSTSDPSQTVQGFSSIH